jgi:hypothetical protein
MVPQSGQQRGLLGVGVIRRSRRPQMPDDLQHHDVCVAHAGHHPHVAGPARGTQDIPGPFEITVGDPGRAPQRDPLAEPRRRRVQDDRPPAVPGLNPGVPAAGPDPARRDHAPGPRDQPPPRRRPGQAGRERRQPGTGDDDEPDRSELVAAGQHDHRQPGGQAKLIPAVPDPAVDPRGWLTSPRVSKRRSR